MYSRLNSTSTSELSSWRLKVLFQRLNDIKLWYQTACHMGTRLEGTELYLIHILHTCDSTSLHMPLWHLHLYPTTLSSKQITVYESWSATTVGFMTRGGLQLDIDHHTIPVSNPDSLSKRNRWSGEYSTTILSVWEISAARSDLSLIWQLSHLYWQTMWLFSSVIHRPTYKLCT